MNKTSLVVIFALALCACIYQKPKSELIAKSADGVIELTKQQFNHWLEQRRVSDLNEPKKFINGYFLEQILLRKKHMLTQSELAEIQFNSNLIKYKKAFEYHKQLVIKTIELDDYAVNQRFLALKKRPVKPIKVRLYQIFKRFPPQATVEKKVEMIKKMDGLRADINNLDEFKIAATEYSDSQSRLQKGLIGNVPPGLLAPELDEIVLQLLPGQMSQVIQSASGILLFYCEKIIQPRIQSDQELMALAEQQVKNDLFNKKWQLQRNKQLLESNMHINWPNDKQSISNSDTVVMARQWSLNFQQLGWLLGRDINEQRLSEDEQSPHQKIIESYAIKRGMYEKTAEELSQKWQQDSETYLLQKITQNILQKLIVQEVIEPDADHIRIHHDLNQNLYLKPAQFTISGLALSIEDNRSEIHKKAAQLLHDLKTGDLDFPTAANQYSSFAKQYPNGFIGQIPKNQLGKVLGIDLMRALATMKTGEYSGLVETEKGFVWILRLDRYEPERMMTFFEAEPVIRNELVKAFKEQLKTAITSRLLHNEVIKYYLE